MEKPPCMCWLSEALQGKLKAITTDEKPKNTGLSKGFSVFKTKNNFKNSF